MKTRSMIIASTLTAVLFGIPAFAQPGPGMGGMEPGTVQGSKPAAKTRDCSQAPNPAACQERREARAKLMEPCKDKVGAERRQCMQEQRMSNTDCTKAANPQRCEERQKLMEACQDKAGPEHRACLREQAKHK